jgi:hypothetical protein
MGRKKAWVVIKASLQDKSVYIDDKKVDDDKAKAVWAIIGEPAPEPKKD